jgi:hypothetical protein
MIYGLDTEFVPYSIHEPVPQLVSVAIDDGASTWLYPVHEPKLEHVIAYAFSEGVALANGPADVYPIWRAFPRLLRPIVDAYTQGRVTDVLLDERTIDIALGEHSPARDYSLESVARRRAGVELDKSEDTYRMRYGELLGLEVSAWPPEAVRYACLDARATKLVHASQREYAAILDGVSADNARADLTLWRQTLTGIHTDQEWVDALDRRLSAWLDTATQRCMAAGLARYKHVKKRPSPVVFSTKAAQAAMLAAKAADPTIKITFTDPTPKHPNGQVALGIDALEEAGIRRGRAVDLPDGRSVIVDDVRWQHATDAHDALVSAAKKADAPEPPFPYAAALAVPGMLDVAAIEIYRLGKSIRTQRTKVVPVLRHPVVRTNYSCLVDSGRTASHGFADDGAFAFWSASSTNFQNQERDNRVRGCLVAPPGCEFAISDFGMLELVALAQVELDLFGRSALAEALQAGIDVHAQFGADMLGIPLADFDKNRPEHKLARQGGKAWNFGKPGGMGQDRFIKWARKTYRVELTPEEERTHTRRWKARYPEHDLFFRYVKSRSDRDGLHTIKVPRCGHVRGGMRFPDACNTHFQTLGAYIAKRSLWKLFVASIDPASPLYGIFQVLFVHDEHVSVCPIGRGAIVIPEQERLMIEASRELAPDVPIKIESIVTRRYKK